jgi:hypothetical protein
VFTPPQPRLSHGRALAAILAVAASVNLLMAEDNPPANSEAGATPVATSGGSGNTVASNGTVNNGNATQLSVETNLVDLQRFLSMSPERLKKLRETIDNLDNMPLAERVAWSQEVNRRLQSIRDLSQEIRGDIRTLPKAEDRSIINRYMMTLYPEDIQPLLKNFQDAKDKPDARQLIIQDMLKKAVANGIKPDPNATDRGPTPNGSRGGNRGRNGNNDLGRGQPHPGTPQPITITPPEPTNPANPSGN